MKVDVEFLLRSVEARNEVAKWLTNRPYTGLDVTDVAMLVDGYDYLGKVLAEITGQDIPTFAQEQIDKPTVQVTYLEEE
jgi:hypothetical protein